MVSYTLEFNNVCAGLCERTYMCMLSGVGGAVSAPSSAQRYVTAPDRGREREDAFRLLNCSGPDRKPERHGSLWRLRMLRRRKGEGNP